MKIINLKANGIKFEFECDSRNTRSGFAHDATLYVDGRYETKRSRYYLNRSWESWTYQSACLDCCTAVIDERIADLKEAYKDEHGLSRVAGKAKVELDEIINKDDKVRLMRDVRDVLSREIFY